MSKPAARVGDQGTPPHVPPVLAPGPGSVNVLVGSKPAWRANLDKHVCACPIAPPAPAPHGPETCFFGSISVLINNQMAVRMGDMLVGLGPPNTVLIGATNVLIGDVGFGLAAAANMAEFCADFASLMRDWDTLSPAEREARLGEITNKQLAKSGVPPQGVVGDASKAPGNASYAFKTDKIKVSQATLNSPGKLTQTEAKELANTVYHEARHAEQWFLMARQSAGAGNTPAQIASKMRVTTQSAQAAAASPLSGVSPQNVLAEACTESVYGSRRRYRNRVLKSNGHYEEYRALPEEQDAWNTGDGLPCA